MSDTSADIIKRLSGPERRILKALLGTAAGLPLAELASKAGFSNENETYSAASWLQQKGLLKITETRRTAVTLGAEGRRFLEGGLPERRVYEYVKTRGGGATLTELKKQFDEATLQVALAWWKRKGLGSIEKSNGETVLQPAAVPPSPTEVQFLVLLGDRGAAGVPEEDALKTHRDAYQQFRGRPGVLELREHKQRFVEPTPMARGLSTEMLEASELIGELTPELIKSGVWRGKEFQSYDLATAPKRETAAKPHPLVQIIEEIREIFVELGFQEIEEDYVQSTFWNMDALFIPQDHPAREMQDTFFLKHPAKVAIPQDVFDKISRVHKTGGGTKSRGWGYALDKDESEHALLRTHTTVGTIRYLSLNPKPPIRVFSIGRVFRHETMDATHLPEFHQIEGIATEEGADFPMLLGILQEFYRRLGFPKLRWRPAYFPYTEPSMEVEVWTNNRWMELGGCGIFRPEVTIPFGVKTPVLAWGLGLERLAMMRLKRNDIRDLYVSDLEWLRSQPLS